MNVVERRMQGAELLMQILVWSPLVGGRDRAWRACWRCMTAAPGAGDASVA